MQENTLNANEEVVMHYAVLHVAAGAGPGDEMRDYTRVLEFIWRQDYCAFLFLLSSLLSCVTCLDSLNWLSVFFLKGKVLSGGLGRLYFVEYNDCIVAFPFQSLFSESQYHVTWFQIITLSSHNTNRFTPFSVGFGVIALLSILQLWNGQRTALIRRLDKIHKKSTAMQCCLQYPYIHRTWVRTLIWPTREFKHVNKGKV